MKKAAFWTLWLVCYIFIFPSTIMSPENEIDNILIPLDFNIAARPSSSYEFNKSNADSPGSSHELEKSVTENFKSISNNCDHRQMTSMNHVNYDEIACVPKDGSENHDSLWVWSDNPEVRTHYKDLATERREEYKIALIEADNWLGIVPSDEAISWSEDMGGTPAWMWQCTYARQEGCKGGQYLTWEEYKNFDIRDMIVPGFRPTAAATAVPGYIVEPNDRHMSYPGLRESGVLDKFSLRPVNSLIQKPQFSIIVSIVSVLVVFLIYYLPRLEYSYRISSRINHLSNLLDIYHKSSDSNLPHFSNLAITGSDQSLLGAEIENTAKSLAKELANPRRPTLHHAIIGEPGSIINSLKKRYNWSSKTPAEDMGMPIIWICIKFYLVCFIPICIFRRWVFSLYNFSISKDYYSEYERDFVFGTDWRLLLFTYLILGLMLGVQEYRFTKRSVRIEGNRGFVN